MNKHGKRNLRLSGGFFAAFVLWTAAVCMLDVRAVGPLGTSVGLASLNLFVHERIGVHWGWYTVTDWLGLIPIALALGFAALGAWQLFRRKSLFKVDGDLLALGGCYLAIAAAFLCFEACPVNYRPVLIDGALEASYPSSTTLLVSTVIPTAVVQLQRRLKENRLRRVVVTAMLVFAVLTVMGRLVSGVHWVTDIVGGVLLGAAFVHLYRTFAK